MQLFRKRDLKKCGIYAIINKTNNKMYIGKSINIYERIRQHINYLNKKSKNENRYLIHSWKKYGRENFEYKVLEYTEKNDIILKEKELYYINLYNTLNRNYGYNLRLDSETKCLFPIETRQKMSESKIIMYSNPNYDKMKHSHNYWINNPEAKKEMAKKVSIKKQKYNFEQYDLNNNLIKVWNTIEEIILENPNYKWQNIYSVCNGYKPTIYGYIWRKIKI